MLDSFSQKYISHCG